jgi:hypothetical protein
MWLSLEERERVRLVRNSHQGKGVHPTGKLHWVSHVLVENYLARGHGPSQRALARLLSAGVGRHEAIHLLAEARHRAYATARRLNVPEEVGFAEELSKLEPT